MKRWMMLTIAAVGVASLAFTVTTSNWKLKEEHYAVTFTSKRVDGGFTGLKTNIEFDADNLQSAKIWASIDAGTVKTGNGLRDKHARQALGAEEFPAIRFESVTVAAKGSGYEATGKLTMKDVTRQIKLPFTFKQTGADGVFAGNFSVKPADYHISKMGTPDEVTISLNVPVKM